MATALISLLTLVSGQSITPTSVALNSSARSTFASTIGTTGNGASPTSSSPVFTVPASADIGANLLPNIHDPEAVNAQEVCPGYKISHVREDEHGLTAILSLAGKPCNAYGTDIDLLNLTVQYQAEKRLAVNISPAKIDASNYSHYILSEDLIPRPKPDASYRDSDLGFDWGDDPSFWFQVIRHSTGDVLFNSKGKTLVYQNQFIEFVSQLPSGYNLYGLGERIHGLRLGNNFTATIYAADVGDPIDENLYGSHPFYLDTRYYTVDNTGTRKLATGAGLGPELEYESFSHGVYLRNAHGQEVILAPQSITWRTLGGSIDLYFFDGPTQPEVTSQYQQTAIGLPAMQSYWTFGFHQCRWGYRNWTELRQVLLIFKRYYSLYLTVNVGD
jgi:alpha-glucosidase